METNTLIKIADVSENESPVIFANPVQIEKVQYTGKTHTTGGGRDGGSSQSDDRRLDVAFTVPGSKGNGTNPEQMFAAGWSACFIGAMKIAAKKMKVIVPTDLTVDTEVDLTTVGEGYFIQARLNVSLPGLDRTTGKTLIEAAHQTCPYSKATRGNINVTINLV